MKIPGFFNRLLDAFFGTMFLYFVVIGLMNLPIDLDILDPVEQALQDLEITDMAFSKFKGLDNLPADTNIVLVNIKHLDRAGIADLLNAVNKYEPSVVGIDAFFRNPKSPMQDFPLMMAMSQTKNLVLVTELQKPREDEEAFDSVAYSHPDFSQYAYGAFANLKTGEKTAGFRTVREFSPFFYVQDTIYLGFAAKIASLYNKEAFDKLMRRNNLSETINWRGQENKFYAIDSEDLLESGSDFSFIKGKIVLMGYLGEYLYDNRSVVDKFYTPLNERSAGRSYPDMFGLVVHANSISMILKGNYIEELNEAQKKWLGILITFVNVFFFIIIADRFKPLYDLLTKSIQIIEAIILLFLTTNWLYTYDIKIDMTYALIMVLLSGDLIEVYAGSLRDLVLHLLMKYKLIPYRKLDGWDKPD